MNIFSFLLYDFLSFLFHIILLLFCYRFFTKRKCNIFSRIAEKQIEDFWGSYSDTSDDSMDKFVESIHVVDDTSSVDNVNEKKL